MSRNYRFYLEDIRDNATYILQYNKRMSFSRFIKDVKTQTATIKHLENIGEAARQLTPSLKERYSDIKWNEIIALRNILVHQYFGINYRLIWATIQEDIPTLLERINEILAIEPPFISD